MPQTIVVETFDEFTARHGGRRIKVDERGWVFPDGAAAEQDHWANWIFTEPPEDSETLLKARERFFALSVRRAERDFAQLKGSLLGMTDASGILPLSFTWPEEEYGRNNHLSGPEALKRLASIVAERRSVLRFIQKAIEELPSTKARRQREAEMAEAARRREEADRRYRDEVSGITI